MSERDTSRSFLPSRRDLLFGGLMLGAAGVVYARTPRRAEMAIGPGELEKIIPLTIGSWRYETSSGLVLPPPDQLADQLYSQQLTRVYVSDQQVPVMLLIAYGDSQNGMLQVHRPEVCYPAGGYTLSKTRVFDLPLDRGLAIPVKRFSATSQARTEQLLYWTRIGGAMPVSWAAQRLAVVEANLQGVIPDGILVRVSTIAPTPKGADEALELFAREMVRAAGPRGERLLVGTGAVRG